MWPVVRRRNCLRIALKLCTHRSTHIVLAHCIISAAARHPSPPRRRRCDPFFATITTSIPSAQLGTTAASASVGLPLRGKPHHGDIRTHGLPSVLMPSFPPTQETFCHECVTDYVEKESKCPSCNQPTFANAPRPNTQMAAMVDHVRKLYELVPLTQRVKRKSH